MTTHAQLMEKLNTLATARASHSKTDPLMEELQKRLADVDSTLSKEVQAMMLRVEKAEATRAAEDEKQRELVGQILDIVTQSTEETQALQAQARSIMDGQSAAPGGVAEIALAEINAGVSEIRTRQQEIADRFERLDARVELVEAELIEFKKGSRNERSTKSGAVDWSADISEAREIAKQAAADAAAASGWIAEHAPRLLTSDGEVEHGANRYGVPATSPAKPAEDDLDKLLAVDRDIRG